MRKFLTFILAALILATGAASAARITGLTISHDEAFTIASIEVEGDVRYTHQTEVAKDGKPFRIIVDIPSATHEVGAKRFINLPDCKVVGIRSSQYAVDPENIVRVVFDMKVETAYRIEADKNSVKLYVYDPDANQFPVWSSLDVVNGEDTSASLAASVEPVIAESTGTDTSTSTASDPASIIAAINMALDEDRKLSQDSKTSQPAKQADTTGTTDKLKTGTKAPATEVTIEKPTFQPEELAPVIDTLSTPEKGVDSGTQKTAAQILEEINRETALSLGDVSQAQAPARTLDLSEIATGTPAETTTATQKLGADAHGESSQGALTADSVSPNSIKTDAKSIGPDGEVDSGEQAKTNEGSKLSQGPVKKTLLPTSANKMEPSKLAEGGVETGTIAVPDTDDQSTARFRRDPATSRKIKGTLVAEFPTRLVITYNGNVYRDPFETLINDSKVQNNPMEQRVPNVEGLRLVGILESYETDNSALFEDKDGYGYILKAGDKVQKGYVLRVDEDRVYFQIFEYGWSRTVALEMEIF